MVNYHSLKVMKFHRDYHNSISIGLFIKHGSKNESEKHSGITHFVEHMLFKTNLKSNSSKNKVEQLGGYLNAYTTKEYLCIHGKILSEYQDILLNTIIDIVLYPSFTDADIEIEKQVILNELSNYENNEVIQCENKLINEMLNNHPLSRSILGSKKTISNFARNHLKVEHKNILRKNKVLSIAGNIDKKKIDNVIAQRLNELPENKDWKVDSISNIDSYKNVNIKRQNNKNMNVISHAFPGVDYSDNNIMLYNIFANVMSYGSESILSQILREEKGLVYNAHCLSFSFEEGGVLLISCSTYNAANISLINDNLLQIYDKLIKNGISIERFNMMKEILKTQVFFNAENPSNIMFDRAKNYLLNINKYKDIDYEDLRNIKSYIDDLDYRDLNKIIKKTFSEKVSSITSTNCQVHNIQ